MSDALFYSAPSFITMLKLIECNYGERECKIDRVFVSFIISIISQMIHFSLSLYFSWALLLFFCAETKAILFVDAFN